MRASPSKNDSMPCGKDSIGCVARPSSPYLGCVRRHRRLGAVYLRRGMRTYFDSLMRLKVSSLLLLELCA
jgi:hypothetical protein